MDTDHILKRLADCLVITKSRLFGWKNPVKSGIHQLKICNFHKNSFVCFVSRGAKILAARWRKTEKNITVALWRNSKKKIEILNQYVTADLEWGIWCMKESVVL